MNFEMVIATTNPHKVNEYRKILSPYGITLYSFSDLNLTLPKVEENGKSFEENAIIKANAAANIVKFPVFADDSGLCIEALNGFPGIKTARFAKESGGQINANQAIVNLLLNKNHNAYFNCTIALLNVGPSPLIFEGIVKGQIAQEYHNETGFGYDPIFIPDGYTQDFFKLDANIKNTISHRARACLRLITMLKINGFI